MENFSLHIGRGEHIALMGPSGCGKTSLIRCIAGLIRPDSGGVEVKGRISCVFQESRLLPWLNALDNINVVLSDSPSTLAEAQKWLEAVGLGEDGDKLPSLLSGGMRQRVNIARALAYGGDILLLDEPMKGMDTRTAEAVAKLISDEAKDKTCILVTHDPAEAQAFGERVYVYRDRGFYPE